MAANLPSLDVQVQYTPSGNYYSTDRMSAVQALPAADQAMVRKVVGQQHAHVLVQYLGYDVRAGRQRCCHCHTGGGRALGPTGLRFVWYGQVLQTPLVIGFRAYRWRCPACKKTYTDYPAGVLPYSRHSVPLLYAMLEYLRGRSVAAVSRRYHIAEKTLSTLLLRAVDLTPDWDRLRREQELHLVVDEHSFAGNELVITVGEARTRQVLAILRNDLCASLKAFLRSMPRDIQQRVTCAATDLKEGYRRVLLAWKPQLRLSADPFHVVRLATHLVDEERRLQQAEERRHNRAANIPAGPLRAGSERLRPTTRARRTAILAAYPTLACLYALKEQLRAVYLARTAPAQRLLFEEFERMLAQAIADPDLLSIRAELLTFQRTLRRWRGQIMMYFDTRLSTAMVEGFHTVVKLIKRISFGFRNVTRYRAKVMLGLGCRFTLHVRAA